MVPGALGSGLPVLWNARTIAKVNPFVLRQEKSLELVGSLTSTPLYDPGGEGGAIDRLAANTIANTSYTAGLITRPGGKRE